MDVNETDGQATVCVELNGQLRRDIDLELAVIDSGMADLSDFNSTTLSYTFLSGSSSGDRVCEAIDIIRDGIVESSEDFSVELTASPPFADVSITRANATIRIMDSPLDSELVLITLSVVGMLVLTPR